MPRQYNPHCYLAAHGVMEHGDPMLSCQGGLIHAHLLPRNLLRREGHVRAIHDPRSYVLACGGITGISGHHGAFDASRVLRLSYEGLPDETIELARELRLLWWLQKTYGGVMA